MYRKGGSGQDSSIIRRQLRVQVVTVVDGGSVRG